MMQSVLQKISAKHAELSTTRQKIADWVLLNSEQAAKLTSQELAQLLSVSQSSIVKFTQEIGFNGYIEFKLALSEDIGRNETLKKAPLHTNIFAEDPTSIVSHKLLKIKIKAMMETSSAICQPTFLSVLDHLNRAKRIQIIGMGGSALTAKDLGSKLLKLGLPVVNAEDIHGQLAVARTMTAEDVQIAISFSGSRKEIVLGARTAKQQGAAVIALSASASCELAEIADETMLTIAEETENRSASIAARTAQNVIIDLIFISLIQQQHDDKKQLLENIKKDMQHMQQ